MVSEAGAWTTPNRGFHLEPLRCIKAILTVNMPFLLMNSFVPSNGSTSQHVSLESGSPTLPSYETIGVVSSDCKPSTITSWAAISAFVNGDSSPFWVISKSSAFS